MGPHLTPHGTPPHTPWDPTSPSRYTTPSGLELKRVFWNVLNEASRNATYDSVVGMVSTGTEHVDFHSDTCCDIEASPYVEGAAVMIVMRGKRQCLWTRALTRGPFHFPKSYNFKCGIPSIELEDYSAYAPPELT
jgi:hypothetical protein